MGRMRIRTSVVATAFASLVAASAAGADGLPVLGIDVGGSGVVAPAAPTRYVTIAAAANTSWRVSATTSGKVQQSRVLNGTFTIPAVAYDGSASGLSHDGKTLDPSSSRGGGFSRRGRGVSSSAEGSSAAAR